HHSSHSSGSSEVGGEEKERSPIFFQWMECIWQILHQFPDAFEFNETFLLSILKAVYGGMFGNFMGNSECERRKVARGTRSVWGYLLNEEKKRKKLVNAGYLK